MPVLILYVHPLPERSRANRCLIDALEGMGGITVRDLYAEYPDHLIEIGQEQAAIAKADALVFQHPLYWYSAPALLKEWLDLVLTHGFAYGKDGRAIAGKPWLQAITAGGDAASYRPGGLNGFTIDEFLRPFEATAALCGAIWQPPFILHDSHKQGDAALLASAAQYRNRLERLISSVGQSNKPGAA